MDPKELQSRVDAGLVKVQQHPTLPLRLYNYADRVQYDRLWDDVVAQCRGLVMHGEKVVARPFRKFFNDTEHSPDDIPWHEQCEITEKMDGSLLIVFCFQGEWVFCTRGSFVSAQAARGKEIFEQYYGFVNLDPSLTYLFEVIFPDNRIVVDYGGREDVVLLAMIETTTGRELPLDDADMHLCVVRRLPATASVKELRSIIRDDEEGYVCRFANGFRMKVKGARYMELHRIFCGVSSRSIWECLSQGKSMDEVLAVVPDEFAQWVKAERSEMLSEFERLNWRVECAVEEAMRHATRKEKAAVILSTYKDISSAAFLALDDKPFANAIWKMLYPEYRRPSIAERLEA